MYFKLFFLLLSTILLARTTLTTIEHEVINTTNLLKDRENSARILENEIKQVVECIRQFIINGVAGLSLDPFEFPILPLNLDTPSLSSSMILTNIFVGGLASFNLDKGTVNIQIFPPKAEAEIALSFGQIKLQTNYDGNMNILNLIKLFGKGSLSMKFDNLKVSLRAVVGIPLAIKEVNIQIQLPSTTAVISGLFNDDYMSGLISRQMSETLTQLAQEQQTNFNELINDLLQQLLKRRLVPGLVDWNFDELVEMADNDRFSCDLGAQTTFQFLNESINNFLMHSKK